MKLPFLSKSDRMFYPTDGCCPMCGSDFKEGVAYISGGALLMSPDGMDSIHTDRLEGFLHLGFHGKDSAMRDSASLMIVDDIAGGQYDLQWCSVRCMRSALNQLLDEIELSIKAQSQTDC